MKSAEHYLARLLEFSDANPAKENDCNNSPTVPLLFTNRKKTRASYRCCRLHLVLIGNKSSMDRISVTWSEKKIITWRVILASHTAAARVRTWARTWTVIGWSQSDSEGFSPVFLPPQKSTFPPKSVSPRVLITSLWRGRLGNHPQRRDVNVHFFRYSEANKKQQDPREKGKYEKASIFFFSV